MQAGFPDDCPNYFANSSAVHALGMAVFNESLPDGYFIDNLQKGTTCVVDDLRKVQPV